MQKRLQAHYDAAPSKFPTLQSIVDSEIAEGTSKGSKSCTVGLLWLKRCSLKPVCHSVSVANAETSVRYYTPWGVYVILCRALEFICVFLETVVGGEEDLVKAAHKAYDESLRKYHGWIVRGIFSVSVAFIHQNYTTLSHSLTCSLTHSHSLTHTLSFTHQLTKSGIYFLDKYFNTLVQVAVRAVPYHKDFVVALKKDPSVTDERLYGDMQASLAPLRDTINELNRFYTLRGQNSDETV